MKTNIPWLLAVIALSLIWGLSGCGQQTHPKEEAQLVKTMQVGTETDSTAGTYSGSSRVSVAYISEL